MIIITDNSFFDSGFSLVMGKKVLPLHLIDLCKIFFVGAISWPITRLSCFFALGTFLTYHTVYGQNTKLMKEKSITSTVRAVTVVELNVGSLGSFWYTTLYLEITPFGMLGWVQLSRRE